MFSGLLPKGGSITDVTWQNTSIIGFTYTKRRTCDYVFIHKIAMTKIKRSDLLVSGQAAITCPSAYHPRRRLHVVSIAQYSSVYVIDACMKSLQFVRRTLQTVSAVTLCV